MQSHSLTTTNRYPVANATEQLDGYIGLSVLRRCGNALTDVVVYPSRKAALFARKFFQTTTAGLCAFGLEFLSESSMSKSNVVDSLGAMNRAIAIDSNVSDAHVDAKDTDCVFRIWLVNIATANR